MKRYYKKKYGKGTIYIPYMMDGYKWKEDCSILERYGFKIDEYFVWAGRLVPDNNLDILLDAYEKAKTKKGLVIIGDDYYQTPYLEKIKRRVRNNKKIILTGFIPRNQYLTLIKNSYAYIETKHSGGTHPTLLDGFSKAKRIISIDREMNKLILNSNAVYFNDQNDLSKILSKKNLKINKINYQILEKLYKKEWVIKRYIKLFTKN